ncbi:MAG: hypothetical protein ACOY3Z_03220 [Thermodesulfobacteriota bacterium]
MRRSPRIALTLLASISLAACDSADQPTSQSVYLNRQDCAEEWSDDDCETDSDGHWRGPHYYYHSGRHYYYPRAATAPAPVTKSATLARLFAGAPGRTMATASGSKSVSRGGFGSMASRLGGSGS